VKPEPEDKGYEAPLLNPADLAAANVKTEKDDKARVMG